MFGTAFERRDPSQHRDRGGLAALLPHGLITTSPTTYTSLPTPSTTLSGPFSQNSTSPYIQPVTSISREVSPLTPHPAQLPATPYNPQDWGPVTVNGVGSREAAAVARSSVNARGDGEPIEANPPPPYTRRAEDVSNGTSNTIESLRQVNRLPVDAIHATSRQSNNGRPLSMIYTTTDTTILPPPPTTRSSSSSRIEARTAATFNPPPSIAVAPGNIIITPFSSSISQVLSNPEPRMISRDVSPAPPAAPPATRRAISADTYSMAGQSSGPSTARPSSSSVWRRDANLPGPPPGPPPSAARSSSASGVGNPTASQMLKPASRLRNSLAPTLGTRLDPPPPTPADFVSREAFADSSFTAIPIERIQTTLVDHDVGDPITTSSITSGLSRSSARRETLAKGFRDRRNARRSRSDRLSLGFDNVTEGGTILGQSIIPESSMIQAIEDSIGIVRSADATPTQNSEYKRLSGSNEPGLTSSPTQLTGDKKSPEVRSPLSTSESLSPSSTLTPPISPGMKPPRLRVMTGAIGAVKVLPTPPSTASQELREARMRPISYALQLPNNDEETSMYRSPNDSIAGVLTASESPSQSDLDRLISESTKRHAEFLLRERSAQSDIERLKLFSQYIVDESRLRRQWYANVWRTGSFDPTPTRNNLFGDIPPPKGQVQPRSPSTVGSTGGMNSEPPTPATSMSGQGNPWWNSYQPALSPIASMSNDEVSSRGRTSSRWWESQTGSDSGGVGPRTQRSKRESKYMGLQRDSIRFNAEEGLYEIGEASTEYPENDYPPEKINPEQLGYYEESPVLPTTSSSQQKRPLTIPQLDISRFITLPPPYPRHYPAVNNSHPALSIYRAAVRTSSDISEVAERRTRNEKSTSALRKEHQEKIKESQSQFRANIQAQIEEGSISYAEAAEAEQAVKGVEREHEKKSIQAEYDSFQDIVLHPLHEMLNERLSNLTQLMTQLQDRLSSEARRGDVDQTQEEGDEEPQLLEKLTLLKWLFEAREQLHVELFQLLTDRNDKFKKIVLLPYQQVNNLEKVRSTDSFFIQDYKDRKAVFRKESLERYNNFLSNIEENVRLGVDLQSSTYWDIAPGLLDLLQQVPEDLTNFQGVQIPEGEYVDNPSYHRHPLQYLYSVISHAEKSSYQFIEAQINLQCLLHEAKSATVAARCKSSHASCEREGGDSVTLREMTDRKNEEEMALTSELRQTTALIESQWVDSLGGQMQNVKERVKKRLVTAGGWEEVEQEEAMS